MPDLEQSIIGIDPGANGAIAVINPAAWTIEIIDTPNRVVQVNKKDRTEVDVQGFAKLLSSFNIRLLVSEKLHSRPGQNSQGTFSLGRFFGQIEMGTAMMDVPHFTPTPQEWKRRMSVSADKDYSRQRAAQLIPAIANLLTRKKDHDRAEAAMLGLYGCFYLGLVPELMTLV